MDNFVTVRGRSGVGRPRQIEVGAIADAALAIGLDRATIQNVAALVGVSAQALYQYVAGREELLRLAGQHALSQMRPVIDCGQHWAIYLREAAEAVCDVIVEYPQLVALNLAGMVDDRHQLLRSGDCIEALCARGFAPEDAVTAAGSVTAVGLACAIDEVREEQFSAAGQPWPDRVRAVIAGSRDRYPNLDALSHAGHRPGTQDRFDARLRLVLLGIAVEYGLPEDDVVRAGGIKSRTDA